jgi:hypothetical protein
MVLIWFRTGCEERGEGGKGIWMRMYGDERVGF